jgi:hypothetical protein
MELSSMEDVLSWLRRLRPGEDLDPAPDLDPVPDPAPDPAAVPDPVGAATKEADPNPDPVADPLHPRTERILEAVLGQNLLTKTRQTKMMTERKSPDPLKRGMTAKMGIGIPDPDPVGDLGIVRIQEIERIPDPVPDREVL